MNSFPCRSEMYMLTTGTPDPSMSAAYASDWDALIAP